MIFYWASQVLHIIEITSREIAEILKDKGYSCSKSTINEVITRYKEFGLQLLDIGKCSGSLPAMKSYEKKMRCSYQLSEERTYAEVETILGCTPQLYSINKKNIFIHNNADP